MPHEVFLNAQLFIFCPWRHNFCLIYQTESKEKVSACNLLSELQITPVSAFQVKGRECHTPKKLSGTQKSKIIDLDSAFFVIKSMGIKRTPF